MTFRDYIYECENYEYSAEYYELMKECSELSLMERYLENQNFISNINESAIDVNITSGYFAESVDDNSIQKIYEEAEAKKSNIVIKTLKRIGKTVKIIWNFLKKFFSNYTRYSDLALNNQKKMHQRQYTFTSEQINDMIDGLFNSVNGDAAKDFLDSFYSMINAKPGKLAIIKPLKIYGELRDDYSKAFDGILNLAVANMDLTVKFKNDVPIDIKDFISILNDLTKKKKSKINVAGIRAKIDAAKKNASEKGVTIYGDVKKMNKFLNDLENINNAFESIYKEELDEMDAESSNELVNIAKDIQSMYVSTSSSYTAFISLKKFCVNIIDKYLIQSDKDNGVKASHIGKAKRFDPAGSIDRKIAAHNYKKMKNSNIEDYEDDFDDDESANESEEE
jgi:hypothetical protein